MRIHLKRYIQQMSSPDANLDYWGMVWKSALNWSQGYLMREYIAAAILGSRMEHSYWTSGFFIAKPLSKCELPFPRGLNHTNENAHKSQWISTKSKGTISHIHMWPPIWLPLHSLNTGVKKSPNFLLNFLDWSTYIHIWPSYSKPSLMVVKVDLQWA